MEEKRRKYKTKQNKKEETCWMNTCSFSSDADISCTWRHFKVCSLVSGNPPCFLPAEGIVWLYTPTAMKSSYRTFFTACLCSLKAHLFFPIIGMKTFITDLSKSPINTGEKETLKLPLCKTRGTELSFVSSEVKQLLCLCCIKQFTWCQYSDNIIEMHSEGAVQPCPKHINLILMTELNYLSKTLVGTKTLTLYSWGFVLCSGWGVLVLQIRKCLNMSCNQNLISLFALAMLFGR